MFVIPNHFAAHLSNLDLTVAKSVVPGGNWKQVPHDVPSQRLHQIRESYAAGKGSRSTYYGRLRPDAPAYTINTYFSRPGNGCHLHYDYAGGQHRTLSQREAARLQSFPDNFIFSGSKTSINQQIGNAVPPLLGFQIAQGFPERGYYIDLFCGAGGLSLGFKWAGWEPILGNDIEKSFLQTYQANVHHRVITGDIRDERVFDEIVTCSQIARAKNPNIPLLVIGGPPCQGFSTAGNRRSLSDPRNWLFAQYKAILSAVQPSGFVFENVTGLLNMEGGQVFDMVKRELQATVASLHIWKLRAEEYGVPQRRTRVIIVGDVSGSMPLSPPKPITCFDSAPDRFNPCASAVTVYEALSDLPPIEHGEDGSQKDYLDVPSTRYQQLMRSLIDPAQYLAGLGQGMITVL